MSNNTVNFNKALYDCATECSLRRINRTCKINFDSVACQSCRYYVKHYVNADPRHVELFMMEAEIKANDLHYQARSGIIWTIILIALIGFFTFKYVQWKINNDAYWKSREQQSPATTKVYVDEVWGTCEKVAQDMQRKKDYNGDGLINCIDAAVSFYTHFPDKSRITIERNINLPQQFNHLFNCVLINGTWRAIEPQAAYMRRGNNYFMKEYWGKQYDYKLNKDETEIWKVHARK